LGRLIVNAFKISGNSVSVPAKLTSSTGPIICLMWPMFAIIIYLFDSKINNRISKNRCKDMSFECRNKRNSE